MIEGLLAFLAELLLQFIAELIGAIINELIFRPIIRHVIGERTFRSGIVAICFVPLGMFMGGLSVLALPHHLLGTDWARLFNLAVTPILVGFMIMRLLPPKPERTRFETFVYAWIFAFAFAGTRYLLAK